MPAEAMQEVYELTIGQQAIEIARLQVKLAVSSATAAEAEAYNEAERTDPDD